MSTTSCECQMQLEGQLHVPIVKNTFIEVRSPSDNAARRMSLPAFLCLCREGDMKRTDRKISDVSTSASTIASSSSDSDEWATHSIVSDQSNMISELPSHVGCTAKARESCKPHHKVRMDKIIRRVGKMLEASDMIDKVDAAHGSLILQVHSEALRQNVMSLAQKTFLTVTTESKCIYAMGFASPNAFKMNANGFEVTLGAMENASRACWHVFKKGCCRHGENCSKQHPVLEMPVQVSIAVARRC